MNSTTASIAQLFLESCKRYPNRPALYVDGVSYDYATLARMAGGIANRLAETDAPDRIGIIAYRSVTAYAGILGTLFSGRTYVPLNPKFPPIRNQRIAEIAGISHFVCDSSHISKEQNTYLPTSQKIEFLSLDNVVGSEQEAVVPNLPDQAGPDDIAYIMFTSGTTGAPKGVPISHASVLTYVANILNLADLNEYDRFSQSFDLTFDLSVHDLFTCWAVGACLCVIPDRSVMAPAKFIRDQELTIWFSVPSTVAFMHKLRTLKPGSLPTLRCSWFCGEALPARSAQLWSEAAPNSFVENLYGPTEATIAFTYYRWQVQDDHESFAGGNVPIGKPMGDLETAIMCESGNLADQDQAGELLLGGKQLSPGYWNDKEKSAAAFVHCKFPGKTATRWYKTGDLAKTDAAGNIQFLGRIDNQVKILGHRVELLEIEHVLRRAIGTELVAAIAWPRDGANASGIVAFASGSTVSHEEAIRVCESSLPPYMVPRSIKNIDEFPLNANGKLDRAKLELILAEKQSDE